MTNRSFPKRENRSEGSPSFHVACYCFGSLHLHRIRKSGHCCPLCLCLFKYTEWISKFSGICFRCGVFEAHNRHRRFYKHVSQMAFLTVNNTGIKTCIEETVISNRFHTGRNLQGSSHIRTITETTLSQMPDLVGSGKMQSRQQQTQVKGTFFYCLQLRRQEQVSSQRCTPVKCTLTDDLKFCQILQIRDFFKPEQP